MQRFIVIHYGEIALKGDNRGFFEQKLIDNIKLALKDFGDIWLKNIYGRLIILVEDEWDLNLLHTKLQTVFGIEYFAVAWNSGLDMEQITGDVLAILKKEKFKTFRITAKRTNKNFPFTSQQIAEKLGAAVIKKLKKKVDLVNFDLNCYLEIVNEYVLIYLAKIRGRGGLPVGVSEPLLCLLSGGIDSPVAANLMQKRGSPVIFVNFDSYPATVKENQEKVKELVGFLKTYQVKAKLYIVPFLAIQKEILSKVPEDYRVIFYRRMMLRISQKIAQKENILALVTGESLGQVASQTVENIRAISEAVSLPILRPCIGLNKEEIINLARQIGTFEISSQPFTDCCSLFVPKHPIIRADLNLIQDLEKDWDFEPSLTKAVTETQIINL
jgi:thiamine biosynthesis protein ThiI